jgi:ferredoxin
MQKIILKSKLNELISNWMKDYEVVAPVKDKNSQFKKVEDPKQISYDFLTQVTAKSHFIPDGEKLLEFKDGKIEETTGHIKKTIMFGMRKCDLNAVQVLDKVMYDKQYLAKRKNTVLVGLFCESPDKYCFCNSLNLTEFWDLFFYPKGDNYIIDVKGKKGINLVKHLPDAKKEVKIPNPVNFKKLNTRNIEKYYKDDFWDKDAKKCLSCTACTVYCPTCNCMDIKDTIDVSGKFGARIRHHMSCMIKSFSRIAGGKSFRDSRLSRFKHFVYHKISYFEKQRGRPMCVGCGRCLRVCPTKIDWVNTINMMNAKVIK